MLRYIKNVLSEYIGRKDQIISKRIKNYTELRGRFEESGLSERFKLEKGIVPGVFMFRTCLLYTSGIIYDLICENRSKFGRPIYMTLDNILSTGEIWPVEFFKVESGKNIVASAIFYRNHNEICYAVYWGDNDEGRPLRAMDFLLLNLFVYYKEAGFRYMDLGISTENGIPNEGLLRFKESHEAISSLRYRFILDIKKS